MRRVFLVTIAVIALGVALAGVALANAGPHGAYVALEDKCASCHRSHSGSGTRLTRTGGATVYGVCTSCHDATGSYLDILNGALTGGDSGAPLLGGGFEKIRGAATTSSHNATGNQAFGDSTKAWGYQGNPGTSSSLGYTLSCASCHDPHGNTNYQILRATINTIGISIYPTRGQTLPVDDATNRIIRWQRESYGGGSSFAASGITYSGFAGLCGSCHTGYLATTQFSGSGAAPSGVYTHRVQTEWNNVPSTITVRAGNPETSPVAGQTIPLANYPGTSLSGAGGTVICLSCHYAHGTTASMGTESTKAGQNSSSSNLRISNRGTCQGCHEKS